MIAKTQFTLQEMMEILTHYRLGTLNFFEPVSQGTVQTNYFVNTTSGKFVFRYYENRSTESVLFESSLLTYLKKKDYPCPVPIKNIHGKYVGLYQNKPYVFFEFIEGHHLEHPNEAHKSQLIQKAAELQCLTQRYRPRYKNYRWNFSADLCRRLARVEAEKIHTDDANRKLLWLENQLSLLCLPQSLPKGICHCDFHFSNVLFRDDRFAALIDFDDANYTYLVFDLAGLIQSWACPHPSEQINLGEARIVVQEYMKYRLLSDMERLHLFDVYKLSILFDCLWYFGRGTSNNFFEKRKIEFLNNMGRNTFVQEIFPSFYN